MDTIQTIGQYRKGSILAVSPDLTTHDYRNEATFFEAMEKPLRQAYSENHIHDKTVIVFPEHIGTYLVAVNEREDIYNSKTIQTAMRKIATKRSNFFKFILYIFQSPVKDRAKYAIFRLKTEIMEAIYKSVFSELARSYNVTIVAGSIILSGSDNNLYNSSFIFRPDGSEARPTVHKVYPIEEENRFIHAGNPDFPVFEIPGGRMAVLICADSWYPEPYEAIKEQNPDIIVVPSYVSPAGVWDAPWQGYNGREVPSDIQKTAASQVNKISEKEAWLKYSLPGRIQSTKAAAGILVYLRAQVWNLEFDGQSIAIYSDSDSKLKNYTGQQSLAVLRINY